MEIPWLTSFDKLIEVNDDLSAFGGINLYGCGIGRKDSGEEFEFEYGASEDAAAVIAFVGGRARGRKRTEEFVIVGDLDIEILPEVVGAEDDACGRIGTGACGTREKRPIALG